MPFAESPPREEAQAARQVSRTRAAVLADGSKHEPASPERTEREAFLRVLPSAQHPCPTTPYASIFTQPGHQRPLAQP